MSDDLDLLTAAFALANTLHRGQTRKGTAIPYVSHLMAVAGLVLEDGGSPGVAAAALLHDAGEDQGGRPTLAMIERLLGADVAAIVEECSDSLTDAEDEKPPWLERKQAAIAALAHKSPEALLVTAADKLHNARATLADLTAGEDVWTRFKTGRPGFMWYHREMLAGLRRRLPDSRSVAGLAAVLDEIDEYEAPAEEAHGERAEA